MGYGRMRVWRNEGIEEWGYGRMRVWRMTMKHRRLEWMYEITEFWGWRCVHVHVPQLCVRSGCFFKVFNALLDDAISLTAHVDPATQGEAGGGVWSYLQQSVSIFSRLVDSSSHPQEGGGIIQSLHEQWCQRRSCRYSRLCMCVCDIYMYVHACSTCSPLFILSDLIFASNCCTASRSVYKEDIVSGGYEDAL